MTKHYLQLEFKSGLFFIYSSKEEQGYEKHTSKNGNVSFRKYFKEGVSGDLDSVSLYEGKFGNQISISIKNGEDLYFVPVDVADQKGNVDTYAESLIKFLPSLTKGDKLTVRGYNFTPEGDKYAKIGISITQNGEKLKATVTNAYYSKEGVLVEGDIPAIVWKKDALGKNKPSAVSQEAKNDYLLALLTKEIERLKFVKQSTSNQESTPEPQDEPKAPKVSAEEDHSDLPFK